MWNTSTHFLVEYDCDLILLLHPKTSDFHMKTKKKSSCFLQKKGREKFAIISVLNFKGWKNVVRIKIHQCLRYRTTRSSPDEHPVGASLMILVMLSYINFHFILPHTCHRMRTRYKRESCVCVENQRERKCEKQWNENWWLEEKHNNSGMRLQKKNRNSSKRWMARKRNRVNVYPSRAQIGGHRVMVCAGWSIKNLV